MRSTYWIELFQVSRKIGVIWQLSVSRQWEPQCRHWGPTETAQFKQWINKLEMKQYWRLLWTFWINTGLWMKILIYSIWNESLPLSAPLRRVWKYKHVLVSAARPAVTSLQDAGREPPNNLDKRTAASSKLAAHVLISTFHCGSFCLFTGYASMLRLHPLMFITVPPELPMSWCWVSTRYLLTVQACILELTSHVEFVWYIGFVSRPVLLS